MSSRYKTLIPVAMLAVFLIACFMAVPVKAWSPPPQPNPVLEVRSPVPRTVNVGQSFRLALRLTNRGGYGERGGVSVSVPPGAEIEVLEVDSALGRVDIVDPGGSLWDAEGREVRARRRYVLTQSEDWRQGEHGYLTLKVTPTAAGDFRLKFRASICFERYWNCSQSPRSWGGRHDSRDELGFPVNMIRVNVRGAPEPPDTSCVLRRSASPK